MRFDCIQSNSRSSRFALWAVVGVLLFKAAVPMLVSLAAQAQGKAVYEVCPLHGVDVARAGHHSSKDGPGVPASVKGGDHCPLTALQALTTPPEIKLSTQPSLAENLLVAVALSQPVAPDTTAIWAAQHKHGPPTRT